MQEIHAAVGRAHATEVLSMWEGFGRFCRRQLGVEPLTLLSAYELGSEDLAAEVLATFPCAKADEAKAEERAGNWAQEWDRRFRK